MAVILFVVAAAVAIFRELQAARALHDVARAAAIPQADTSPPPAGAAPGTAPAKALPAMPADTGSGLAPITAVAATPAEAAVSALPAPAAAAVGAALLAATSQESRVPGVQADSGGPAQPGEAVRRGGEVAGTAVPKGAAVGAESGRAGVVRDRAVAEKRRLVRVKAADARAQQRKAAGRAGKSTRADRGSATFRRCPPLGTKGAVMCRWHICNGGAGKEPACRPYLERKP